jgi:hypothetical protein
VAVRVELLKRKPEAPEPEPEAKALESHRPAKPERPSDWGSLIADLSRGREAPAFNVHDRTHVEFAIDYRLESKSESETFLWEAYFFAPESLRLDRRTYDKSDIYADLQSYVRFEVPDVELSELTGEPIERIARALGNGDDVPPNADAAMRELRLFACQLRAAGVETRQRIFDALERPEPAKSLALQEAARLARETERIAARLREVLAHAKTAPEPICTAAIWVDEDVSRLIETLLSSIARRLAATDAAPAIRTRIERGALAEARYRLDSGIGGVGSVDMTPREVESLEFRRHLLKRFTSSVLWLVPEVRPGATWVREFLYATAASVAMAFALVAAFWNGFTAGSRGFVTWILVGVLAYAVKDRIKAVLQAQFSSVVDRHFPDRRWFIRDRERGVTLGKMKEQSGFVPFKGLPSDVLEMRRLTRKHSLEEQARPETVLFHRKQVVIHADRVAEADPRFSALTEIFRLDLRRWLAHTDDPKREIVFADPIAGRVDRAEAPRVYNIGIIYRLKRAEEEQAPWNRLRVVVTRKGIRRIDEIRYDRDCNGDPAPANDAAPPSVIGLG